VVSLGGIYGAAATTTVAVRAAKQALARADLRWAAGAEQLEAQADSLSADVAAPIASPAP